MPFVNEGELLRELDELRGRLSEVEDEVRQAEAEQQRQAEVNQQPATEETKQTERRKDHPFTFFSRLTDGRFDAMRLVERRLLLSKGDQDGGKSVTLDSKEAQLAWLALRLRLAALCQSTFGHTLPLVVLADDLITMANSRNVFKVLHQANSDGVQVLLLSGSRPMVRQLANLGASVVRIGLQEAAASRADRQLPMTRAA